MTEYKKVSELKIGDIFSTLNNGRTIYIIKDLQSVGSNIKFTINVLDFQTSKFDNIVTKKYPTNMEITMRSTKQVIRRIFTGLSGPLV